MCISAVDKVTTFRDEAAACPLAFPLPAPVFFPLRLPFEFPLLSRGGKKRKEKREGTRLDMMLNGNLKSDDLIPF